MVAEQAETPHRKPRRRPEAVLNITMSAVLSERLARVARAGEVAKTVWVRQLIMRELARLDAEQR